MPQFLINKNGTAPAKCLQFQSIRLHSGALPIGLQVLQSSQNSDSINIYVPACLLILPALLLFTYLHCYNLHVSCI